MRTLFLTIVLAAGCAPRSEPYQHPTTATGGFTAPTSRVVHDWVELGSPVATAPLQQTLVVSPNVGPLTQLMVKGVSGEARISQILLQYTDNGERTVEMRKVFGPGDGQVIELRDPQQVSKIVVFTEPESTGSVVVLGS